MEKKKELRQARGEGGGHIGLDSLTHGLQGVA